jgi:hypothetical protein
VPGVRTTALNIDLRDIPAFAAHVHLAALCITASCCWHRQKSTKPFWLPMATHQHGIVQASEQNLCAKLGSAALERRVNKHIDCDARHNQTLQDNFSPSDLASEDSTGEHDQICYQRR